MIETEKVRKQPSSQFSLSLPSEYLSVNTHALTVHCVCPTTTSTITMCALYT